MKRKYIFVAFIWLSAMLSCKQKGVVINEASQSENLTLPYASINELNAFSQDDNIVPFDLSWKLALEELTAHNFFDVNSWKDASLHNTPIVLYGADNRPMAYDFVLINKTNQPVGILTTHARKESDIQIKAATTNIQQYYDIYNYIDTNTKYYIDRFDTRYNNYQTKSAIDTNSDLANLEDMSDEELLEWMRFEFWPEAVGDSAIAEEIYKIKKQELYESQQRSTAYWRSPINELKPMIDDIDTTAIIFPGIGGEDNDDNAGYSRPTYRSILHLDSFNDKYWLREYLATFKKQTTGGYCGPWVVSYILSTNYDKYINPNEFDKEGYTVQGGALRGAMTAPCMNNALRDYSNGEVTLDVNGLPSAWDAYWRIIEDKMSVTLLTLHSGLEYHWYHCYGTYRVNSTYYFLMADCGTSISSNGRDNIDPTQQVNYRKYVLFQTLFGVNERKSHN